MPVKWPSYEVDLSDQFQIHVFTLPAKVQLEIMIKDKVADRLDLIIPGGHVRSLTSASGLVKEYEFSRRQQYIEGRLSVGDDTLTRARKGSDKDAGAEDAEEGEEGAKAEEARAGDEGDAEAKKESKTDAKAKADAKAEEAAYRRERAKLKTMDLEGTILVRAAWSGRGPQMPPARSETLFQASSQEKNRVEYTPRQRLDLLQEQRAVDVNDPRYEDLLKDLQLLKNDYLDRLLALDAKF